ncbi:hypothetical protein [uncultured Gilliamella sp.]|uniref:hypothetical protein n=1 Tax=uncultured Gilliamella sp. TaxID=1193505 RepID=UPI0025DD7F3C|nr:hypothetical protein [uncultured Gilliamella sp.]
MSINLNHPIKIIFNEIEIDHYLPSIKFKIDLHVKQFTHFLAYSGEIWIDCNNWDQFSKALSEGGDAILNDMDNSFFIHIIKTNGSIVFTWSINRQDPDGNVMSAGYSSNITDDAYAVIRNEFIDYPKWW